jgi:hypothetical protein
VKVAVAWALETTCTLWEMDGGWIGNMGICNLQKFRVLGYQGRCWLNAVGEPTLR